MHFNSKVFNLWECFLMWLYTWLLQIKEWRLLSKNEWGINMGVLYGSVAHMRNALTNKSDTNQTSSMTETAEQNSGGYLCFETSTGFLFFISIQCAWKGIMAHRTHGWGRSNNAAIDRILNSAIPQCISCRYSLPTEDHSQVCYTKLCAYLKSQVSSAE